MTEKDGIHFTQEGHQNLVNRCTACLKTLLADSKKGWKTQALTSGGALGALEGLSALLCTTNIYHGGIACRAGHRSSENDSMNRQCWFLPLFFYRSFDNVSSSPSFFNRSFNNVGSSPLFFNRSFDNVGSSPSFFNRSFNNVGSSPSLTDHSTMSVIAYHHHPPWFHGAS
jgi:hypothetical protein